MTFLKASINVNLSQCAGQTEVATVVGLVRRDVPRVVVGLAGGVADVAVQLASLHAGRPPFLEYDILTGEHCALSLLLSCLPGQTGWSRISDGGRRAPSCHRCPAPGPCSGPAGRSCLRIPAHTGTCCTDTSPAHCNPPRCSLPPGTCPCERNMRRRAVRQALTSLLCTDTR